MKLRFLLVLAFAVSCEADQSITDRVTGYVTDSAFARVREASGINRLDPKYLEGKDGLTDLATGVALDKAGELIGVDGLTVDHLKSPEGLTNLATGAAGKMLGVDGLTIDQLKTAEGLTGVAVNGAKSIMGAAVDNSPAGPIYRFGMAVAGYEDALGKPSVLTPGGQLGKLAATAGSFANSAIKSVWTSDGSSDRQ